jgi:hypothetical protein
MYFDTAPDEGLGTATVVSWLQYALKTTDALATSSVAVVPQELRTAVRIIEPTAAEF